MLCNSRGITCNLHSDLFFVLGEISMNISSGLVGEEEAEQKASLWPAVLHSWKQHIRKKHKFILNSQRRHVCEVVHHWESPKIIRDKNMWGCMIWILPRSDWPLAFMYNFFIFCAKIKKKHWKKVLCTLVIQSRSISPFRQNSFDKHCFHIQHIINVFTVP